MFSAAPSTSTSRRTRKPAADGSSLATPVVDAWALCAAPNASFTYTSASAASARAKSGSFDSSPGLKRRFSSISTPPGGRSRTREAASGPTQSGDSDTGRSNSSARRRATGATLSSFTTLPFGRPIWQQRTTLHPQATRYSIVGNEARMRESSDMSDLSEVKGTLKSTRTSTVLPSRCKSSSVVSLATVSRAGGLRSLSQDRGRPPARPARAPPAHLPCSFPRGPRRTASSPSRPAPRAARLHPQAPARA